MFEAWHLHAVEVSGISRCLHLYTRQQRTHTWLQSTALLKIHVPPTWPSIIHVLQTSVESQNFSYLAPVIVDGVSNSSDSANEWVAVCYRKHVFKYPFWVSTWVIGYSSTVHFHWISIDEQPIWLETKPFLTQTRHVTIRVTFWS